ncbi:MAG TPA: polysaccharide biosynthesis tyrosine autokinase [Candidatus Polarisedimenticolaceae bacterium]|nr:polysaccharide biosynthesis tyrosine autokinase [Candidatus Polarisedimenticolaceae bacterium]
MHESSRTRHLLDYWAIVRRRRGIVVLCVATVTVATLIGSFLATPLYRSTSTLQIERQKPDILSVKDVANLDYSWAAYADFYQTQYKILSSDAIARKTVERMGLTAHPFFAVGDSAPSLYARVRALLPGAVSPGQQDPVAIAASRVLGHLEIAPIRNSHLVQVSWVAADPALAADVANALVDAYIGFNIESAHTTSDQASEFLVGQVASLKREINELEEQLQGYGESKRIVSVGDDSNITLKALSDIASKRTQAQTVLAEKEAAYRAALSTPSAALPQVLASDLIARLKEEHASLEAEYSEKSRLFKDDWPGMQQLRSKLEQSESRLREETEDIGTNVRRAAESAYRQAQEEVRSLTALLEGQEGQAQSLKRNAVEFKNLQSEVDKKRETLNAIMARQNEMALTTRLADLDATSSNVRIVDRARPAAAPFRPNKKMNLALALAVGLGLGIAAALFLDYLDNTIGDPAEIERVAHLPVLAVVPHYKGARAAVPDLAPSVDLVAHRERGTAASEAYRELRTAILLSSPGHPPRQIMVTSALPEDGKSSTAINLAVVLAQSGRRVLLVDADLRRPRLHRVFGHDDKRGLSTILSGLETDPSALVRPTAVSGLDLLVSGPVPPNPSELLDSPVFVETGRRLLAAGYDHVVFDSPPALAVADPVIVASAVGTAIIVARAGRTPRESLKRAVEKFAQAGIKPIGVVLNDLDPGRHGYASYYGSYGRSGGEDERERHAASG